MRTDRLRTLLGLVLAALGAPAAMAQPGSDHKIEAPALEMTGMRGATTPEVVRTITPPALEMTGMRGATPADVVHNLTTPALEMTGLRPDPLKTVKMKPRPSAVKPQ